MSARTETNGWVADWENRAEEWKCEHSDPVPGLPIDELPLPAEPRRRPGLDPLPRARSQAELARTVFSAVGALCSLGSLSILIAHFIFHAI